MKWLATLRAILSTAVPVGLVVVMLLFLMTILWRVWFNNPPVRMRSLDPLLLGILCPGDSAPIHVHVDILEPVTVHYYISVMDAEGKMNLVRTQVVYTDMLHPRPASFDATFPWTVPQLESGRYRRVFSVRSIMGTQKSIYTERAFEIGGQGICPEEEN